MCSRPRVKTELKFFRYWFCRVELSDVVATKCHRLRRFRELVLFSNAEIVALEIPVSGGSPSICCRCGRTDSVLCCTTKRDPILSYGRIDPGQSVVPLVTSTRCYTCFRPYLWLIYQRSPEPLVFTRGLTGILLYKFSKVATNWSIAILFGVRVWSQA